MLPTSFVHATLVALNLPRQLADRYTIAPDNRRAPHERDREHFPIWQPQAQPDGAPIRPFPSP